MRKDIDGQEKDDAFYGSRIRRAPRRACVEFLNIFAQLLCDPIENGVMRFLEDLSKLLIFATICLLHYLAGLT
jgi:hypothetical protein